jgi:DNA-directed RNA polymerase specialized sigma24 family protein
VDAFVDQIAWTGPTPETRALHAERDRAVDTAVAQLPTRRRELMNAIFRGADNDYVQVSRSTGMPVGSIGPTRGRALVELRGRMQRGGYGPEDLVA